jgi:NAD(P)-dependent dehydrogenase (short-subunit alcohol dehydrogenase family)
MRIAVVGATGTIGKAVADALAGRHDVVRASRKAEVSVDIGDVASIQAFYARLGRVDAVISCAGDARFGPVHALSDEDFALGLQHKLMGQVNLVRHGLASMNDGGVFLLTAGIFSIRPMPSTSAIAMANGALESFARAAALDLPRGIRINTVSPPFLNETAAAMGMPGAGQLSTADNAKAYVALVEGTDTGLVVFPG